MVSHRSRNASLQMRRRPATPSFEAAVSNSSASSCDLSSGSSSVYMKRRVEQRARAETSGSSTSFWPASLKRLSASIAPKNALRAARMTRSASKRCCSQTSTTSASTIPQPARGKAGPPEGPAPIGRRAPHKAPRSACSEPSAPAKQGAAPRHTETTSLGNRLSARGSIHATRTRRTNASSMRLLPNASSNRPKSLHTPHSSISFRPNSTTKGASRALFSGTRNSPLVSFSIVAYAGTRSWGPKYLKKTPGGPP
mmetsp:Transcript_96414/g.241723  ORF Transcript_96414/g.241723 Transcript_96414/m.241723 type:complete len:254 (+) Transcript_96414:317-1078(+)